MAHNPMNLNNKFDPEKGSWGNKRVIWRGHQWTYFDSYKTATPAHAAIKGEEIKYPKRTYCLIKCKEGSKCEGYVVYWRIDR